MSKSDPTQSAIGPMDDPHGYLADNPPMRRVELPQGLTLEVEAPGGRWLPCWLLEERRVQTTRRGNGHRMVTGVRYRLLPAVYCAAGEVSEGAHLRLTTTLPRQADGTPEGAVDALGWVQTLTALPKGNRPDRRAWGYECVEVVEAQPPTKPKRGRKAAAEQASAPKE